MVGGTRPCKAKAKVEAVSTCSKKCRGGLAGELLVVPERLGHVHGEAVLLLIGLDLDDLLLLLGASGLLASHEGASELGRLLVLVGITALALERLGAAVEEGRELRVAAGLGLADVVRVRELVVVDDAVDALLLGSLRLASIGARSDGLDFGTGTSIDLAALLLEEGEAVGQGLRVWGKTHGDVEVLQLFTTKLDVEVLDDHGEELRIIGGVPLDRHGCCDERRKEWVVVINFWK
ncbi:hypothetical protein HDK77DRAFT_437496 [Phyllosticta capitalensis]